MPILFDSTKTIKAPATFGKRTRTRATSKPTKASTPKTERTAVEPAAAPETATQVAHVARLTLNIDGTDYAVKPIPCKAAGAKILRLRKADGTTYSVMQALYGVDCTCPSSVWRHNGAPTTECDHVRACRAVGLIG